MGNLTLYILLFLVSLRLLQAVPIDCYNGYVINNFLDYGPKRVPTLPANIRGIFVENGWHHDFRSEESIPIIKIFKLGPEKSPEVPIYILESPQEKGLYVISPASKLEPESLYGVYTINYCGYGNGPMKFRETRFKTAQNIDLPIAMGTIRSSETVIGQRSEFFGGCVGYNFFAASKNFALEISSDFLPWVEVATIDVLLDGQKSNEWGIRRSVEGKALEVDINIYTGCDADFGISEGRHTISFQASLPKMEVQLETPEVSFELNCDDFDPSKIIEYLDSANKKINIPPSAGPEINKQAALGCQTSDNGPFGIILMSVYLVLIFLRKRRPVVV